MTLNEVWFILVTVLFIGFFFLEGFDFGVGMSTRLIARDAKERDQLINTIGPFWDANEVWLLTAGGAIFAAADGTDVALLGVVDYYLADGSLRNRYLRDAVSPPRVCHTSYVWCYHIGHELDVQLTQCADCGRVFPDCNPCCLLRHRRVAERLCL